MRHRLLGLLRVVAIVLPWRAKRLVYRLHGWDVHPTARVGLAYLDAEHVEIGPDVRIGHLVVFARLRSLTIGEDTSFVRGTRVTAPPRPAWPRTATFGRSCRIRADHLIDASGVVEIGDGVTLAGSATQIITHDKCSPAHDSYEEPGRVAIGSRSFIGTRSVLLDGTVLPEGTVVGAGSVVHSGLDVEPHSVVVGVPARRIKDVSWDRRHGPLGWRSGR